MLKKDRYKAFVEYFSKNSPDAQTELNYSNPYELLVAVILSAQCTDKRINLVTPKLFQQFPNAEALANSSVDEVFSYIRSVSYPNNKAKHLVGMANMLVNVFDSVVPEKIEDLIKLPGVGRKTANVISSVVYNKPAMAVDTHVFRVSNRLGLTSRATTPLAVEKQLVKYLPEHTIAIAHHWLILHGRYICLARKPQCDKCPITFMCKYFEKTHQVKEIKESITEKI
ncbi:MULTISPECIES: endonuclease III [Sphingobacterium]|jgi:endonuclease-3|uniref:endonuclease III n=1 Tax=Sphingobacterium TaxID=28453 RepID=UPI00097EA625|nr:MULTISPECIES: endonuclease III [Sphingobacterium]UXD68745.1 endonuclease III [Sphingobacterium faecium]WGQ16458.1 endonuclease III [Sphingobacterium faecium]SJN23470.1 Endonuclease III [Sphingobacterium faecium PCAi_F2.5]HCU43818.1 endonuclease III [Sphingobacterium sp.]